jgi:3-methyl-2-oxobutanoate hydroxymethyltransferase
MPTTIQTFGEKKRRGEKIAVITAYDALTASVVHAAGIDAILVGDSAAMVFAGYETTLPITMDEMLYHTRCVTRGAKGAFVIADMPFMSYQAGHDEALANAGRFLKEAGANAVKLEGGADPQLVARMVTAGIPVMGHLGLVPQSFNVMGGFKAQGKTESSAASILAQAVGLDGAGCFAIVLECVPSALSAEITKNVRCATIGIGAGPHCDGQVSVINDVLGLSTGHRPRHAKRYAAFYDDGLAAVRTHVQEIRAAAFPGPEHEVGGAPAVEEKQAASSDPAIS